MRWILAILILGLLIFFHELGHFILALVNDVEVEEFSIGFGPRLVSFKPHKTRYSLKCFPFGGSCLMKGMFEDEENEDGENEDGNEAEDEDGNENRPENPSVGLRGSFLKASLGQRAAILAAGPVFNFILAFAASVIIMSAIGYDPSEVLSVDEGSAAEEAGLQAGDLITEFNGHQIVIGRDVSSVMTYDEPEVGEAITLKVQRNGEELTLVFTPEVLAAYRMGFSYSPTEEAAEILFVTAGSPLAEAGAETGDTILAVNGESIASGEALQVYFQNHPLDGSALDITYHHGGRDITVQITPLMTEYMEIGFGYNLGREKTTALCVIKYSAYEVYYWIRSTVQSLKMLFTGALTVNDLSGPVGIVDMVGETYEETKSEGAFMTFLNLLNLIVLLSANLGVMNLLPIPAVDGGRLLFVLIEAIRGKPMKKGVETAVQLVAVMLLLILMLYVMYHDISRML